MSNVLLCQGTALALPLKDASVHCCVTSPPYYGLRDYGTGTWQGGDQACTHTRGDAALSSHGKHRGGGGLYANTNHAEEGYRSTCGRCGAIRIDAQLGLEESPEAYVEAMVQVFREVRRVLRPDGTLWLNMGDSYAGAGAGGGGNRKGNEHGQHDAFVGLGVRGKPREGIPAKNLLGMPWRLAFALQQDGWVLRSDIIWDKPSCMPESVKDRPTRSHEYVFLFSKQAHYHYDAEAIRETGSTNSHARYAFGASPILTGQKWNKSHGGSKPNDWAVEQVDGRNARTVWRIASEPTPFAHFATFPQALVRRCLLAGAPSAVCAACSAPYRRVTETAGYQRQRWAPGVDQYHTQAKGPHGVTSSFSTGDVAQKATTGFSASCTCVAGMQPATVLDPFCGSGTTLLVARELGHHAIGLDLSYPYLHDIARERLGLQALAAWEHGQEARAVRYDDLPLFGG